MQTVTIPQIGTANYAPGSDGSAAAYQPGSTLVPNPGKADGKIGTGSNATLVPGETPVPNPAEADGQLGTGTGVTFIPESTPVPNPQEADGGTANSSSLPARTIPSNGPVTYVPAISSSVSSSSTAGNGLLLYWSFNSPQTPGGPYPSQVRSIDRMAQGSDGIDEFVDGIIGTALAGGHSYHAISMGGFGFIYFLGTFSFSCWVKVADASDGPMFVIGKCDGATPNADSQFMLTYSFLSSGTVTLLMMNADSAGNEYDTITVPDTSTNSWHHFVGTYNDTTHTLKLYRDAVLVGSTTVSGGLFKDFGGSIVNGVGTGSGLDVTAAGDDNSNNGIRTGDAIDEIGFWLRELSAAEVSQLYSGGAGVTYPF